MAVLYKNIQWHYVLLICFSLTGCSNLPLKTYIPGDLIIRHVSNIDNSAVFAVSEDGAQAALADNGLEVVSFVTGKRTHVTSISPKAVTWSPDGTQLAALFTNLSSTHIKTFNNNGTETNNTSIRGGAGSVFWISSNELVITTDQTTEHKFGTTLLQNLHRWELQGKIKTLALHETTLVPRIIKRYGIAILSGHFSPQLSPLGDEILFARIVTPPLFTPYYKLYVKNLSSGAEQEITTLPLRAGSALFSHDGESVIWSDDNQNIWQKQLWEKGAPRKLPVTGSNLVFSRDGTYKIIDGMLYLGEQKIAEIPGNRSIVFLASNHIMTVWKNSLYKLEGLATVKNKTVLTETQQKKLTSLRSWLSSGYITIEEYRNAQQRITNQ